MAYYMEHAGVLYESIANETDHRIKDWPLIQSPVVGSIIVLAYILFIYLGPKWMAHRPPFQMKPVIVTYNFFMVIYSGFVAYEFIMASYLTGFSLSCNWATDYSNKPGPVRMAGAVWYFFIAKFIELLDTVFFILRKKNSQVTFLHVFHHGCLPMFWWWGIRAVPGGHGTVHATVNCCVHFVMYLYYGIASLGPQYRKYLWWKRYVTIFQLAQFFIVTLHNIQYLFRPCAFPWRYTLAIQGFTTIVAVLFLNFYIHTYKKTSPKQYATKSMAIKATNGVTTSNGLDISNGHVLHGNKNGHFQQNGYNLRKRLNSNGET